MEPLLEISNFWTIFSYIVTIVIGGVGYRFYKLYSTNQQVSDKISIDSNQQAINSLMQQVASFTEMYNTQNNRIAELEREIRNSHQELLRVTSEQAKAEAKVEILNQKVEHLNTLLAFYKSDSDHE